MRTFNHLKDGHFPTGYPDWILVSIENNVEWVIQKIKERVDLSEIKTIFDIGSLNGIESVKFTEKLSECNVYTFEPNPISLQTVLLSTEGISNIHVQNLAVSNFNGKSKFYISSYNPGASSILKPLGVVGKTGTHIDEIEVNTIRLDDWISINNIPFPDMLWMDVQGSELNIFKGLNDILNNVKAIYVECSMIPYYEGASHKDEVINYLSNYNFELISETHHDHYEGDFMFMKKTNIINKNNLINPMGVDYIS